MKLITEDQRRQMLNNSRWNTVRSARDEEPEDFRPVVKLFCPWSAAVWLLTELDADEPDIAFGLCDLGLGFPELGTVRLSEIAAVSGPGGLRIERDRHFRPSKTLAAYADEARRQGRVVA
jgi:glycine/D-amino acid oxidase-like deaminating enzyme